MASPPDQKRAGRNGQSDVHLRQEVRGGLGRYRRKSIGDGLMSHVSRIGMAEDLKESGLTIRMALRSLGEGSQKTQTGLQGR